MNLDVDLSSEQLLLLLCRKLAKIFPEKFPGKGSPVDIQLICPGLMFLSDSSIPLNKNSH